MEGRISPKSTHGCRRGSVEVNRRLRAFATPPSFALQPPHLASHPCLGRRCVLSHYYHYTAAFHTACPMLLHCDISASRAAPYMHYHCLTPSFYLCSCLFLHDSLISPRASATYHWHLCLFGSGCIIWTMTRTDSHGRARIHHVCRALHVEGCLVHSILPPCFAPHFLNIWGVAPPHCSTCSSTSYGDI